MKHNVRKIILLLLLFYAMVQMWHWKIGFTFFTQLSNLYIGLIVLTELVAQKTFPRWKLTGTVSIFFTFLIFLTLLGPVMPGGLWGAYSQDHYASLCLHLLIPALAIRDFWADGRKCRAFQRSDVLLCLVPPASYLVFIVVLGQSGLRWGNGNMMAPYLFLNYGAPAGWFGFRPETAGFTSLGIGVFYLILVLLAAFLLVGWAFCRPGGGKRSRKADIRA